MGWSESHVHAWTIHTKIKMMVETEVAGDEDLIAEVPFCAWVCDCGQWRWKITPEALRSIDQLEI